jgi:hypothetical protein
MSRGLGWVQRECLRVIEQYEAAGKRPTTFNIAAEVFQVKRGRTISDAQHVSTKRALFNLRRKGLVSGKQEVTIAEDGRRILAVVGPDGRTAERCCFWSKYKPFFANAAEVADARKRLENKP